ncbi:unnamed protein product [Paramecium primaurelia]|uniref:Uncharacterized protein n=1 Tax=Paramecium primaurelia TaxID=5886 RepID=A0A8S1LY19_PARPR|nr:unnamed protein product [Paramecium primaurelia]
MYQNETKTAFSSKQNWKCKNGLCNNDRFFINPQFLLLLLERQILIQNIVILKCSSLMKQDAMMKTLQTEQTISQYKINVKSKYKLKNWNKKISYQIIGCPWWLLIGSNRSQIYRCVTSLFDKQKKI